MTEMLLLAKRNLKLLNREMAYLEIEEDEDYLISACLYTHMAMEFMLKHLLEINGLPSNFTHQIKTLVKMCTGYNLPIPEGVLEYYEDVKDWDNYTLYDAQFRANKEVVVMLHPVLNEWVNASNSIG